jgi:hypothetical protein
MKKILKFKPRPKKHKPTAISNYKASYLDKRSKTYHKIVMTGFSGLFGLVGLIYVFGASASTNGSNGIVNSNYLIYWLVAIALLFIAFFITWLILRNK